MTIDNRFENLKKLLQEHNQGHLLAFWDHLDGVQRRNLLGQIEELDFSKIQDWISHLVRSAPASLPVDFTAAPFYPSEPGDQKQRWKYDQAGKLGEELISAGRVAAFVVAGGQGTRLGFDGPKGDFAISPVRNKTLFRLFAETIAAASRKYNTVCPCYVMTSPLNHDRIVQIFRSNDYYGLDGENVLIFQQGTLPNFDFGGKILLADKANISLSPDGHGGSIAALFKSGSLDDMKDRGVRFISYFQVDNPLVNILDPLFIGLHALDNAEMSSKALLKTEPLEKVGNFCLVDGKVTVIEYSDLPKELANKRNADGSLVFQLGSIAIHIISTSFVEKLNQKGFSLPLHRARKKIPCIDRAGKPVGPTEPNGVKLESFVFDALPVASKSIILQTVRSEEFAPVKDTDGADSPETARRMMVARAALWLESAGVIVPRRKDGSVDCLLEIAPGFALNRNDVAARVSQIPQIKPGDKLYLA